MRNRNRATAPVGGGLSYLPHAECLALREGVLNKYKHILLHRGNSVEAWKQRHSLQLEFNDSLEVYNKNPSLRVLDWTLTSDQVRSIVLRELETEKAKSFAWGDHDQEEGKHFRFKHVINTPSGGYTVKHEFTVFSNGDFCIKNPNPHRSKFGNLHRLSEPLNGLWRGGNAPTLKGYLSNKGLIPSKIGEAFIEKMISSLTESEEI
jgi:hypothetical protein